jgi:hypothetical protein
MPAAAQSDRVVALVISEGDGGRRADAIQTRFHLMGVETLRAESLNNAELRSILIRFSREAADSRVTFVFLDVPVVDFDGRSFVLPAKASLSLATDIFTQGIPIQGFSRSAAQAEQGGAVVAIVEPPPMPLPSGLSVTKKAPDPVVGTSPIMIADGAAFVPILTTLQKTARQDGGELGEMLRQMAKIASVTVSDFPKTPVYLSQPSQTKTPADAVVIPQAEKPPAVTSNRKNPETQEELTLLERSLSRAAKRAVQRKLRDLGLYDGLVDGVFGPQTRSAIEQFQASRSEDRTGVMTRRQLLELSS